MKKIASFFILTILVCIAISVYFHYQKSPGVDVVDLTRTEEEGSTIVIENSLIKPNQDMINQRELVYEAFEVKTNKLIDKSMAYITEQPNGDKIVQWSIVKEAYTHKDEYILNSGWETKSWSIVLSDLGTNYQGRKEGNQLILKGMFNNKDFEKTIKLKKDLPFYYNPKLGLKNFARSDKKKIEFWGFRGDNLTEFKMKAIKKGVVDITIQDKTYKAHKIYWAATGIGEKFFNRVYYYDLEDGDFLSQDPSDGWTMNLVSAENKWIAIESEGIKDVE